jgi:hypothetical protein
MKEELKIEKGIPMPPHKYPWKRTIAAMEIGDSCFVERPVSSVCSPVSVVAKRLGRMVVVRAEGSGSRVWRIK